MAEKIKRALFWFQKSLDIFQRTTRLPDQVEDTIVPNMEALGWTRLGETEKQTVSNPAAIRVFLPAVPEGVTRLVQYASCHHGDTGVTHNPQFVLRRATTTTPDIAIGCDRRAIVPGEFAAMTRPVLLNPGDLLAAQFAVAVVVGSIVIEALVLDLPAPAGEYIPFVP